MNIACRLGLVTSAVLLFMVTPSALAGPASGGLSPGNSAASSSPAQPSGGLNISALDSATVKRFLSRRWRQEINASGRLLRSSSQRFSGALQAAPELQQEIRAAGRCLRQATEQRWVDADDYQLFLSLGILYSEVIVDRQLTALLRAEERRLRAGQRRAGNSKIKKLLAANARFLFSARGVTGFNYCQLVQQWVDNDYSRGSSIVAQAIPQQQLDKNFRLWRQVTVQRQRSYSWGQKYSRQARGLTVDPRRAAWKLFRG